MKSKKKFMILWVLLIAVLFAGSLLTAPPGKAETIQTAMRDAVLHEENQISLFGWKNVNPGLISAMTVSAILLIAAACIRVFVIPKFKLVPGRFQLLLEQAVSLFDGMAKTSSPQRNGFLGAYIFGAGAYIFVGTLFELLGLQAVTTTGRSVTLPAPLSDVNGAIALGCLSYLVILSGGIAGNGLKGVGKHIEGILAAYFHELPSVRRAAQRPAGNGAGLLLCAAELRTAGAGGRSVHPASRVDPGLCSDHAHSVVLRRGVGASRTGVRAVMTVPIIYGSNHFGGNQYETA